MMIPFHVRATTLRHCAEIDVLEEDVTSRRARGERESKTVWPKTDNTYIGRAFTNNNGGDDKLSLAFYYWRRAALSSIAAGFTFVLRRRGRDAAM
jgi:TPR repeat protein